MSVTGGGTAVVMKEQATQHHVSSCPVRTRTMRGREGFLPAFPYSWGTAIPNTPKGKTIGSTLSSSKQCQQALPTASQACQRLWDSSRLTPSSQRAVSRHGSWPGPGQCRLLCLERGFLLQGDKEDSRSSGWFDFAGGIDRVKPAVSWAVVRFFMLPSERTRKQPSPASF